MTHFRLMSLSPEELAAIIERLDAVCREAQELQATLRRAMLTRAREQQQVPSKVPKAGRETLRNRRSAVRGKAKRV